MNTSQRQFKLTVPRLVGEGSRLHGYRIQQLNDEKPKPNPNARFVDLLKKQARVVMADVTECPAPALPSHIARLHDLTDTIRLAMELEIIPACECQLSGKQLIFASTLSDFLACLELTRKNHRAPAFVNQRDEELAKIWHGIELIAGMVAAEKGIPVPEIFTNNEGENER